jgi:hypothetical protein
MNNRYVSGVRFGEDGPVGPRRSNSSHEVEEFNGLRRGQILSVRKAGDKFLRVAGLSKCRSGPLF